jgi:hypothetical protein
MYNMRMSVKKTVNCFTPLEFSSLIPQMDADHGWNIAMRLKPRYSSKEAQFFYTTLREDGPIVRAGNWTDDGPTTYYSREIALHHDCGDVGLAKAHSCAVEHVIESLKQDLPADSEVALTLYYRRSSDAVPMMQVYGKIPRDALCSETVIEDIGGTVYCTEPPYLQTNHSEGDIQFLVCY